jgi:hypothetical protein
VAKPVEAPWPFINGSDDPADLESGKMRLNLPTAEGAEAGAHVARFCDQAEAAAWRAGKSIPSRCTDCVFRRGTVPNQSATTVLNALKCALEHDPFLCAHEALDESGEPTRLCAGYVILAGAPSESDHV